MQTEIGTMGHLLVHSTGTRPPYLFICSGYVRTFYIRIVEELRFTLVGIEGVEIRYVSFGRGAEYYLSNIGIFVVSGNSVLFPLGIWYSFLAHFFLDSPKVIPRRRFCRHQQI